MSKVVPLARKLVAALGEGMSGEAFCIGCKHEWAAVAPVGATSLECPVCHCMKGRFRFECLPPPDALIRVCNCGNDLFYIRPEGHQCPNCGTFQEY